MVVDGLSKRYALGRGRSPYLTLREEIMRGAGAAWRWVRGGGLRDAGAARPVEEVWALRDVSFEVAEGEVFGIIGRNGAGKSTLLKVLSRIVVPTAGYARVRGRVGTLLEVGAGFHPELTGRDNVFLSGAVLGMTRPEIARKFDEIVAFAGVERFVDTPVKHYSTGMYLRLAFAVAAHLETDILVVDEVLAVGDAEFQQKCLGRMREVAGEARTVLFVSHNLPAVRSLCDRCALLEGGRLVRYGDVHDCIAHYLHWSAEQPEATVRFEAGGNRGLRMVSAALRADGTPARRLFMGADLSMEVEFETDVPIRDPRLGFLIHSETGEALVNVDNRYQPCTPYAAPVLKGTIRCVLGQVPLVAGRYSVSLYLGDFDRDTHVVEHAISFEVIERDVFGTGRAAPADSSFFWWPATFRLLP